MKSLKDRIEENEIAIQICLAQYIQYKETIKKIPLACIENKCTFRLKTTEQAIKHSNNKYFNFLVDDDNIFHFFDKKTIYSYKIIDVEETINVKKRTIDKGKLSQEEIDAFLQGPLVYKKRPSNLILVETKSKNPKITKLINKIIKGCF